MLRFYSQHISDVAAKMKVLRTRLDSALNGAETEGMLVAFYAKILSEETEAAMIL